jgi:hypothetical protein
MGSRRLAGEASRNDIMANTTSSSELQRRLLFSLLRPVARLAQRFDLPLKSLEELARLAYYAEARRDATPQAEIARRFGKSLRTIGTLERQLRSDFLAPEAEVESTRQIEGALAQGPLSQAVLIERAGVEASQANRLIKGMVATGRLLRQSDGTIALNRAFVSLVQSDLKARVDGLNHQLDVILDAVQARFLAPKKEASARTLDFVIRADQLPGLADAIIRLLRAEVIDAEEAALKTEGFEEYGLTVALAPKSDSSDP